MLETERHDREPDHDGPAGAGDSAGVTRSPAEVGPDAGPQDKETGGTGRRLFRRGRRAATRPAGPPADDDDGGTGPGHEEGATTAPPSGTSEGARAAGSRAAGSPREGSAAGGSPGAAPQAAVPTPGFASAPPTPEFSSAPPPTTHETRTAQVPWRSQESYSSPEPGTRGLSIGSVAAIGCSTSRSAPETSRRTMSCGCTMSSAVEPSGRRWISFHA